MRERIKEIYPCNKLIERNGQGYECPARVSEGS